MKLKAGSEDEAASSERGNLGGRIELNLKEAEELGRERS